MIQKYHATTTKISDDEQLYIDVPKHVLQQIGWDGISDITASLQMDSETGVYRLARLIDCQLEQEESTNDSSNKEGRF